MTKLENRRKKSTSDIIVIWLLPSITILLCGLIFGLVNFYEVSKEQNILQDERDKNIVSDLLEVKLKCKKNEAENHLVQYSMIEIKTDVKHIKEQVDRLVNNRIAYRIN